LEQELDQRFSHVVALPQDLPEQGELSTAEKIRREWQTNSGTQLIACIAADPEDPNGLTSDAPHLTRHGELDTASNEELRKALAVPIPPSSQSALDPATPISIYSIPGSFLFHDIPEEEVTPPEAEKVRCLVPIQPPSHTNSKIVKPLPRTLSAETVDPLTIPLPDSPLPHPSNCRGYPQPHLPERARDRRLSSLTP